MSAIIDIANDEAAAAASLLGAPGGGVDGAKSILFFWAEWHAPSSAGGPFDTVVTTLARQDGGGGVRFFRVLAEGAPGLSRKVRVRPHRELFDGRGCSLAFPVSEMLTFFLVRLQYLRHHYNTPNLDLGTHHDDL